MVATLTIWRTTMSATTFETATPDHRLDPVDAAEKKLREHVHQVEGHEEEHDFGEGVAMQMGYFLEDREKKDQEEGEADQLPGEVAYGGHPGGKLAGKTHLAEVPPDVEIGLAPATHAGVPLDLLPRPRGREEGARGAN